MITFFGRVWARDEEGNIFSQQTKTILVNEDEQSLQEARKSVDEFLTNGMPNAVKTKVRYFYNEWESVKGR